MVRSELASRYQYISPHGTTPVVQPPRPAAAFLLSGPLPPSSQRSPTALYTANLRRPSALARAWPFLGPLSSMKAPRTDSESLLPTSGIRKIGSQGGVQLCLRVARLKPPLVLKPTNIINSSFLIHTLPFASRSHLSIVPTRLSLESIAAHKFCYNPSPSSGAQAHYERHPPQLSKCSPPPQFSPPEERRRARPRFLRSLPANIEPRSTLDPAQSHGHGLWSLNSRKENDQDHAVAPPRPRSIVGTTAIGRAQKTTSLSFSLSRGLTPGRLLQTRPTAWAWSLVSQ